MKQAKTETFPLEIKKGSTRVKIYRTVDRGRERYTLGYYEGGRRVLRQFADLVEAKREGAITAEKLNAGQGDALQLNGAKRDAYLYAVRELEKVKMGLVPAVDEYVEAKKIGVPLATAAHFYHAAHSVKRPVRTVLQVVSELVDAKRIDGASALYLSDLNVKLNRFANDFHLNIGDVTTKTIDDWLRGLKMSGRSRNNFRNCIVLLFNFAASSGYLDRDRANAATHTAAARKKPQKINPFTPAEMSKLLAGVEDRDLPYIALGGFCGLRTSEIERLHWEDIRWEESSIVISEDTSKQGEARRRRIAPLTIPGAAWLAKFKRRKGRVTSDDLRTRANPISAATGVKWKTNGLRKGFITHRVAELKDFVRVAFEAGNSPAIIRKTYDGVATEAEGRLWFSIMPKTAENVVQMKGVA